MPPDPVRLVAGEQPIDGYRLVKRLGRGGFAEVWQALGPGSVPCALKFVSLEPGGLAASPGAHLEVRALDLMKEISHPHLVRLFGAWLRDDYLILAMELAERTSEQRLREAVASGLAGIPGGELLHYLGEAAEALDFLNLGRGIQHRDVKPQNMLLQGPSLLLADFGLAKLLEHTQASHTGALSVAYAAPEFFGGRSTRWSDQYSLAVSYCQLRGNALPFRGTALQVMDGHRSVPPDLSMLPAAEVEVVARALSKAPDQRWPSCRAFVEALRQASGASSANMGLEVQGLSPEQTLFPLVGEVLSNSLGMRLVRVPRGMVWMGGGGGRPGERPVTISHDFYLGAFLVTQAQWEALMVENPSLFSRHGGAQDRVAAVSDEELRWFPVESVSWAEAQGFLQLLNAREVHPGWVYRLPTEAEWEYACRGASASREDSSFDFYGEDGPSNDLSSTEANFDGSKPAGRAAVGPYLERTCRVGRYRPNRLGLYDLHGNVWEWCDDRYDGGEDRVLRGGGWFNSGASCRAAARRGDAATRRHGPTGFRVALVPRK